MKEGERERVEEWKGRRGRGEEYLITQRGLRVVREGLIQVLAIHRCEFCL